jgi:hypothetical protein
MNKYNNQSKDCCTYSLLFLFFWYSFLLEAEQTSGPSASGRISVVLDNNIESNIFYYSQSGTPTKKYVPN